MKVKAKRDIAYNFDDYGIDFKQNEIYVAEKDTDGYYVDTENGSTVCIGNATLRDDFEIMEE